MNHKQIDEFINNLRTRLINHRHVIVEGRYFETNPDACYDKIEIELYSETPTEIPRVATVWEDGSINKYDWRDLTGIRQDNIKVVYNYCPIKLSTIKPIKLLKEVIEVFQLNHVSTIEE